MFPLHVGFFEGWNSVLFVPCSAQDPDLRDLAEVFFCAEYFVARV